MEEHLGHKVCAQGMVVFQALEQQWRENYCTEASAEVQGQTVKKKKKDDIQDKDFPDEQVTVYLE